MNLRQLARVDLNLLVTLQVLLEERSVSRAALRLHLTQPAISKTLARLRELLGDPLFQRASRGLVPTPFALGLAPALREWLETASQLFEGHDFDPARYHGEIAIEASEMLHLLVLPPLAQTLAQRAPGITLKMHTQYHDQLHGLEQGELDFVLNLEFSALPPGFLSEVIHEDGPALFARAGHPLHRRRFRQEDLFRYPRLSLRMADMERFQLFQPREGLPALQQVWPASCQTDNLGVALGILGRTDYILPAAGILSRLASRNAAFKALPVEGAPAVTLRHCLISHQRTRQSAVHRWLRQTLVELLGRLLG